MAISNLQQARQNYGLGSFVKKVTRKITKPFTKAAGKIVPKEIAGIMRFAAPFLPTGFREAAYLMGTAKQTGRISPMDLALAAAPTFFNKTTTGENIKNTIGGLNVPFTDKFPKMDGTQNKTLREFFVGGKTPYQLKGGSGTAFRDYEGVFGSGGKMFKIGSDDVGIFDTKAGQLLFGKEKEDGSFAPSLSKLFGIGAGTLALIQNAKTPDDAGNALVDATGNSDDYMKGYNLFSQLDKPGLFDVPEQFRLPAMSGGLMRTNYAMGSEDPKPLPSDPTEPVNPFRPKPIGPFPSKTAEIPKDLDLEKAKEMFIEFNGREPIDMQELLEFFNVKQQAADGGIMRSNYSIGDMAMNQDQSMGMGISPNLGSRPTAQESGLGGLPIEADLRYTGGFMPYGAVEKADDVPARLSKNEFVFTADAVRAAGGGSVQKGAKKMYDTMKQLEKKPEAKGAMA